MHTLSMKAPRSTYRTIELGGKVRLSRPTRTVYPLPAVRCDRKATTSVYARDDVEPTAVKVVSEWAPGLILAR